MYCSRSSWSLYELENRWLESSGQEEKMKPMAVSFFLKVVSAFLARRRQPGQPSRIFFRLHNEPGALAIH